MFFIALTVALDVLMSNPSVRQRLSRDPVVIDAPFVDDEDVAAEAERVQALCNSGKPAMACEVVLIDRLRKVG